MNIIETERLYLSRVTVDNASFLVDLLNEPSFLQYIGDKGVRATEEAVKYIKTEFLDSYAQRGFGLLLVKIKHNNTPIGICGIKKRNSLELPEIGYAFLSKFRSKGYATESARAVIDYARNGLGLKRVVAITSPENEASVRVLEKIGFQFEKMIDLPDFESKIKLFTADL